MPSEIVSVSLKHELRKELDKASKGNRSLYIREAIKDKLQKEME